jgi:hypothetical protein
VRAKISVTCRRKDIKSLPIKYHLFPIASKFRPRESKISRFTGVRPTKIQNRRPHGGDATASWNPVRPYLDEGARLALDVAARMTAGARLSKVKSARWRQWRIWDPRVRPEACCCCSPACFIAMPVHRRHGCHKKAWGLSPPTISCLSCCLYNVASTFSTQAMLMLVGALLHMASVESVGIAIDVLDVSSTLRKINLIERTNWLMFLLEGLCDGVSCLFERVNEMIHPRFLRLTC